MDKKYSLGVMLYASRDETVGILRLHRWRFGGWRLKSSLSNVELSSSLQLTVHND